jgi:5-(carboxyamino)imidazole ribonucleotide mutase
MDTPLVGLVISAENELPYMEECERILIGFGIPYEIRVLSLQQAPERCIEWARAAAGRGMQAIVVGTGWASSMASAIAAFTSLPVIAVPLPVSSMHGLDALMGMAQSNLGAPVATMAVGKTGAANAGLFATRILSLKYPHLMEAIQQYRVGLQQQVEAKDNFLLQDRLRRRSGNA